MARTKRLLLATAFLFIFAASLAAGTIHGFVRDKDTGEPIIMGNVWVKSTTIGTTTNMKGFYVLAEIPPGNYEIVFRYIGFKTEIIKKSIGAGEDIELDVQLESAPLEMKEVVVTAKSASRELDVKPGQITADMPRLGKIPALAETDLFRSLQMLPGVATLSDFSAGLYIRGGSPDQNLILLDGIDVYNPNHLFGFFSTFNSDAIKSVELLKGGFPAYFGGRLSSVLNVFNKEGNRKKFHGISRLSLLSASATLEGPWKKGSWMISGRRTYLDLAAKIAKIDLPYYFYDGHAKINFDIDSKNQASLSFYLGNDKLDLSSEGTSVLLSWGNRTFSAQWTHLFSSKIFSHFILAGSQFNSDTDAKFDDISFGIHNKIQDLSLKGNLTYSPSERHSIDFGFESKALRFGLRYLIVESEYPTNFSGNYYSLFAQDNFKISPMTILQTGLRTDFYSDGNYLRVDPRISLKQFVTNTTFLTFSYGKFHQFLNLVQQQGMSFADMWFPVDETFSPGEADHYIVGYNFDNLHTFSLSLEGYYKNYRNLAEFRTERSADEQQDHQTAAQIFYRGTGFAYGADVYLRNHFGKLEGWLGYSLAWTKKKIIGYNFNKLYFPTYDRRHTITVMQSFRLSKKWNFSLAFKFGSGQPYTQPVARYVTVDQSGHAHYQTLEGEKNYYRLPDYHRLDLGIQYQTHIFGLKSEISLQAINVYNHENVWFREYQIEDSKTKIKDYGMLPFLPTAGITVEF